ncbi:tRNA (N6-isopentenyl adenosine(37)-C2)-methylthiotransferase MiaB [uncultured Fretibacterium sp.]|uniref:tRNA (N6-isopentenyl adenosine(37)-C2)-methylthiotransferase MiaB n=1 Tax=uncultured Fretibacterium sp. TaxID=1678694 RepID=UPI00261882C3|nr:tRNA (N6-isopentenyl adenosine(37)-C2)-methylthiotransferase MiaB [uncultured Fretibacterium sp.]
MHRFCMKVYGCQMNVYDSDRVRTVLLRRGWREAEEEDADLVVITGCSVRAKAEQKVWSDLGRYEASWSGHHRPVLALTGCIAQSLGKRALSRFPWVRLVSGPRHIGMLPDGLERVVAEDVKLDLLDADPREFFELDEVTTRRENPWRAYVTIAYGCDNFCTYCIVPYVRGRFLSRPAPDVLNEVRALVEDGVREVTLLGQNVNSYGRDLDGGPTFAELLRSVARTPGLDRVRFVTSLPQDFTRDIVDVMAEEPAVCPSLNLPIQSGSDRVLKRMNRKYARQEFVEKVAMVRGALPELGLTTDLIVGFPGETEEDFEDSLSALSEIRFDLVHSAAYSEREGTPAATMPGALPQEVRLDRLTRLNELQDGITLSINRALQGRTYRVLADGRAPRGAGLLQGRTPTDKVVIFPGDEALLGHFVDVRITEAESWCLHGERV